MRPRLTRGAAAGNPIFLSAPWFDESELAPFGRALPGTRGTYPVSERIAGRLVRRLPMHPLLDDADVERVIEAVTGRPA